MSASRSLGAAPRCASVHYRSALLDSSKLNIASIEKSRNSYSAINPTDFPCLIANATVMLTCLIFASAPPKGTYWVFTFTSEVAYSAPLSFDLVVLLPFNRCKSCSAEGPTTPERARRKPVSHALPFRSLEPNISLRISTGSSALQRWQSWIKIDRGGTTLRTCLKHHQFPPRRCRVLTISSADWAESSSALSDFGCLQQRPHRSRTLPHGDTK